MSETKEWDLQYFSISGKDWCFWCSFQDMEKATEFLAVYRRNRPEHNFRLVEKTITRKVLDA